MVVAEDNVVNQKRVGRRLEKQGHRVEVACNCAEAVAARARAMKADRQICLRAGMDDYLAKPIRPVEWRAVIERWGNAHSAPCAS